MAHDSARDRIARLTRPVPADAPTPAYTPAPVHAHNPAHMQPQQRMVRLHCYVDPDQMAYLNRVSQAQGVDKAVFVRHIIDYYREHGPLKEMKA